MTSPKISFATLIMLSSVVTVVVTLGVIPLLALTGVGPGWASKGMTPKVTTTVTPEDSRISVAKDIFGDVIVLGLP